MAVDAGSTSSSSSPSRDASYQGGLSITPSISPHNPALKPASSILANPHEVPTGSAAAAKAKAQGSSLSSTLKSAFMVQQPGKQMKTNGKPLGKSFERKVPLPEGETFAGAPVLDVDPRGEGASAGDGVVLTTPAGGGDNPEAAAAARATEAGSMGGHRGSVTSESSYNGSSADSEAIDIDSPSEGGSPPSSVSGTTKIIPKTRGRTDTMSTDTSSASSSSRSASIRFAPLPVSGRLKRANSITIGVAARSQMLHSQGAGRSWNQPVSPYHQQHMQQFQQQSQRGGPSGSGGTGRQMANGHSSNNQPSSSSQQAPAWHANNGSGQRPDDVIDLGEEISKRARSAWKRMRGSSASKERPSKEAAQAAAATGVDSPAALPSTVGDDQGEEGSHTPAGGKTPRRPSTPDQSSSSLHHPSQGSHRDHFPPHEAGTADVSGSGAATPGAGSSSPTHHHDLQRRVSTGAFLGNSSLREMQEERRRQVLGLEGLSLEDGESQVSDDYGEGTTLADTQDEESRAATMKEGLGRTGAGTVLGRLAPWTPSNPFASSTPATKTEGKERLVRPHNPEVEENESTSTSSAAANEEAEGEDPDDEEMKEAEALAEESMRHGSKAAGVEKVH